MQYQALPPIYAQNSSLELAWSRVLEGDEPSIAGERVAPFLTEGDEGLTIDYPDDFERAEALAASGEAELPPILQPAPMTPAATSLRRSSSGSARSTPSRHERAAAFADACRINTLTMVEHAGSGHIGTSFSCARHRLVAPPRGARRGRPLLLLEGPRRARPLRDPDRRSAGSPFEQLFALRRLGGLPGHPDVLATPEVVTNTGSLGMGISKARGFVLADRLAGRRGDVYVLTGDGELQEGQFWESLQPTANRGLGEITVIVDHNKLQSDTWVSQVSDLGDLEREGGGVRLGGRRAATATTSTRSRRRSRTLRGSEPDRPKLLVADTLKGARRRVHGAARRCPRTDTSLYDFHSGAPGAGGLRRARSRSS